MNLCLGLPPYTTPLLIGLQGSNSSGFWYRPKAEPSSARGHYEQMSSNKSHGHYENLPVINVKLVVIAELISAFYYRELCVYSIPRSMSSGRVTEFTIRYIYRPNQGSVLAGTPGNGVPKVILAVGTPCAQVFEDKLKKQGIH